MAKYFLMPGFDRPHSQGILLFSRDGNKLVTNPPVKNLGWVFVWVCTCAPTHAQGPESRRQARSLALKRTTESTESQSLILSLYRHPRRCLPGARKKDPVSLADPDLRQQGSRVVTMQTPFSRLSTCKAIRSSPALRCKVKRPLP